MFLATGTLVTEFIPLAPIEHSPSPLSRPNTSTQAGPSSLPPSRSAPAILLTSNSHTSNISPSQSVTSNARPRAQSDLVHVSQPFQFSQTLQQRDSLLAAAPTSSTVASTLSPSINKDLPPQPSTSSALPKEQHSQPSTSQRHSSQSAAKPAAKPKTLVVNPKAPPVYSTQMDPVFTQEHARVERNEAHARKKSADSIEIARRATQHLLFYVWTEVCSPLRSCALISFDQRLISPP